MLARAFTEQLSQQFDIERLDEMVVEAGFARASFVVVLPQTGERGEDHVLAPGLIANPRAASLPLSLGMPISIRTTSGKKLGGGFNGRQTVVRGADVVAISLEQQRENPGRAFVVVNDQHSPAACSCQLSSFGSMSSRDSRRLKAAE